jgi:hypothetical protein
MRPVLRAIFRARQRQATLPLYDFLRDDSIPARCRLSFYPCLTLVVVALDDLAKCVMRDERSWEKYQQLLNAHTWDGDNRWSWYLADLANLGFDQRASTVAVLQSVFSDETRVGRVMGAKLAHLVYGASPIERLVIIEAIEAAGSMLFGLLARLANEIRADHGPSLRHLGDLHYSRQTGAGAGVSDERVRVLRDISLDPSGRTRCMTHVERVFYLFHEWTSELLAFAVTQRADEFSEELSLDHGHARDGHSQLEWSSARFERAPGMP